MINSYYIGIDEGEVVSSLFHGNEGFPTYEGAEAHRRTYDWLNDFRVYHVRIAPVDTEDSETRHSILDGGEQCGGETK